MPLKFNAADKSRLEGFISEAHTWLGDMCDHEREYEEACKAAATKFNEQIALYNEFRNSVTNFVEDIMSVASDEIDGKSERWQESDKGCAAAEWVEQLNNFVLTEEIELIEFTDLNHFDQDGFYDELSELPTEPQE